MQALSPHPQRSDRRERSRVGIQRPQKSQISGVRTRRFASRQRRHHFLPLCSEVLLPLWSNVVVRCSPRLRRCSSVVRKTQRVFRHHERASLSRTTTRSAHRRLRPSVRQVGVGHSEPPVKGSRLRSLEPLWGLFLQAPTEKQEAPTSTSEGRSGPSAVGRGSSQQLGETRYNPTGEKPPQVSAGEFGELPLRWCLTCAHREPTPDELRSQYSAEER